MSEEMDTQWPDGVELTEGGDCTRPTHTGQTDKGEGGGMSETLYVLLHKSGHYFKKQNLYLGTAVLTSHLDSAAQMSLSQVEEHLGRMTEKEDWEVLGVALGVVASNISSVNVIP